jgi:hypothetical protein
MKPERRVPHGRERLLPATGGAKMSRLVGALALAAAALWSVFAWAAYTLIGWIGGLAGANADRVTNHPETVEWLSLAGGWLTGGALAVVVVIWLVGLGLIVLAPQALRLLVVSALHRILRSRQVLPRVLEERR